MAVGLVAQFQLGQRQLRILYLVVDQEQRNGHQQLFDLRPKAVLEDHPHRRVELLLAPGATDQIVHYLKIGFHRRVIRIHSGNSTQRIPGLAQIILVATAEHEIKAVQIIGVRVHEIRINLPLLQLGIGLIDRLLRLGAVRLIAVGRGGSFGLDLFFAQFFLLCLDLAAKMFFRTALAVGCAVELDPRVLSIGEEHAVQRLVGVDHHAVIHGRRVAIEVVVDQRRGQLLEPLAHQVLGIFLLGQDFGGIEYLVAQRELAAGRQRRARLQRPEQLRLFFRRQAPGTLQGGISRSLIVARSIKLIEIGHLFRRRQGLAAAGQRDGTQQSEMARRS